MWLVQRVTYGPESGDMPEENGTIDRLIFLH